MATNYIEREAVLNILASKNAPWDGYQKVSELPVADVQPVVHGKWEQSVDDKRVYGCSECYHIIYGATSNFCPYFGARMDGET